VEAATPGAREEPRVPTQPEDVDDVADRPSPQRRGTEPAGPRLTGWRWVFLSRQTGRQGIVALPNLPLWVWIASVIAQWMPFVDGRVHAALGIVGSVALVVWAVGELWRGVSPFRRLLGFAVLVGMVVSVVR
jgi:hypothetical protein